MSYANKTFLYGWLIYIFTVILSLLFAWLIGGKFELIFLGCVGLLACTAFIRTEIPKKE